MAKKTEATMAAIELKPADCIAVVDFRKHPEKIKQKNTRILKMLKLGSTEIGVVDLECCCITKVNMIWTWLSQATNTILTPIDVYLSKEVNWANETRLREEDFIGLLELRHEALISAGFR